MDTAQQPVAVNGRRNALGTRVGRLAVDGRVRVFPALLSDADMLVAMLQAVHEESPQLNRDPFSVVQARKSVMGLLARTEQDTMVLITYLNGDAIGCMGAIISPQLTCETAVATELLLYVSPQHRGSRAALSMVRAFEEWAAPYDMRVGSSLGIDDEKAINFYARLGYQQNSVGLMKRGRNDG